MMMGGYEGSRDASPAPSLPIGAKRYERLRIGVLLSLANGSYQAGCRERLPHWIDGTRSVGSETKITVSRLATAHMRRDRTSN